MWYFAYGSNLLTSQMVKRTRLDLAAAQPRRAFLPGYRLAFNMAGGNGTTYANIVTPGDGVKGVIYLCTPEQLKTLDGFESGYDRAMVEVQDETGSKVEAVAYIAKPDRITTTARPSAEYLDRIVRGAREHGLPDEYISAITGS